MDSLLTPNTELLNSLLDCSEFETPSLTLSQAPAESDVFSYAFGHHNNVQRSEADHWSTAQQYITPPATNKSSSSGTRDHSIDKEQQIDFPMLSESEIFPILNDSDFLGTVGSFYEVQEAPVPDISQSTLKFVSQKPKGLPRKRNRKPLSPEVKDLKHKHFLERNRIAADTCRRRKKLSNDKLEEKCRVLELRNTLLKEMRADLIAEVQGLREKMESRAPPEEELGEGNELSPCWEMLETITEDDTISAVKGDEASLLKTSDFESILERTMEHTQ